MQGRDSDYCEIQHGVNTVPPIMALNINVYLILVNVCGCLDRAWLVYVGAWIILVNVCGCLDRASC
jgi:hypothetical protein